MQYAIVLPAFNETDSLRKLLDSISNFQCLPKLIVVVDDSPDQVSSLVAEASIEAFRSKDAELKVISNGQKGGRGKAVLQGLEYAFEKKEIELFIEMDSDGSHQVREILLFLEKSREFDCIIASRYLPKSNIQGWPVTRIVFSRILNGLIRRIFRLNVRDCTNGYRSYSRVAVKSLLAHQQISSNFTFLTEQLLVLENNHLTVFEFPSQFVNRVSGKSSVGLQEIAKSLIGLIKVYTWSKSEIL